MLAYEGVNEGTLHVSRVLLELKHLARTYHFHPLTEEERKERGREIVFVAAANTERYIYILPGLRKGRYTRHNEIKFGE